MNAHLLCALGLCLCSLTQTSIAIAQDFAESPEENNSMKDIQCILEEAVLSTASKSAESAGTAPATSVSISAEDLRIHGIQSLDDAINFLALGMVTQNPLHAVDIGARGVLFTADFGNHVLLLVNGHAMNEQWNGTAYFERGAAVPFELIDHIEIVLGPGSVLYGSNAMLGVINVITKRAKDYEGIHLIIEGTGLHVDKDKLISGGRIGAGFGKSFQLFGKSAEFTGQLEYYTQDGPAFTFSAENYGDDSVTGAPKRFNPDGTNAGTWGGAKAEKSYYTRIPAALIRTIIGNLQFAARVASYKRATPYSNDFNVTTGDFDDPNSYELDRWIDLDLSHKLLLSQTASFNWRIYADFYHYYQQVNSSAAEDCIDGLVACQRQANGRSRWGGLEAQLSLDWLENSRLVTMIGVEGRIRHVSGDYEIFDPATSNIKGSIGVFSLTELMAAVYLQQTARPWRWLDLSFGVRLDADQSFGSHLAPRAAASFHLWNGSSLKAVYSEAFRAPTAYELKYVEPNHEIPAPHLRPEIVRSLEGVIEQRFGTQRILLGVFYSRWSDLILNEALDANDPAVEEARANGTIAEDISSILQFRNSASLESIGGNAAIDGSFWGGTLRYGLTITAARARRGNETLAVSPSIFGNARLSYALPGSLPHFGLALSFQGRRPADRAFDGGFDPVPYASEQIEIRGSISGFVPGIAGLSYGLSANLALSEVSPYVAGPVQEATSEQPSAQLAPVDRFHATLGLRLDL